MIFADIEDTTYLALYTIIRDVKTKRGLYRNLYSMIPLIIDAKDIEEAKCKAKEKANRKLILEEVLEINANDKNKILNFYI